MRHTAWRLWFLALLALGLVGGCASGDLLDNNVQSFSNLPALTAQPTYRFERLPSQQAPNQAQLEAMAEAALQKAGLRRDDANPRYSAQIEARLQPMLSPWARPWDDYWGWGWDGWHHGFWRGPRFYPPEPPWYHREVSIVLRELATQRVVFESHAQSDEPVSDSGSVFPAMFDAALVGFPNPPTGPRKVSIQVGRR